MRQMSAQAPYASPHWQWMRSSAAGLPAEEGAAQRPTSGAVGAKGYAAEALDSVAAAAADDDDDAAALTLASWVVQCAWRAPREEARQTAHRYDQGVAPMQTYA